MLGLVSANRLKEQEQLFESQLEFKNQTILGWEKMYEELLQKYEDNLQQLELAINNETLLNEQTGRLAKKINNFEAFPSKKFNISKAIDVLTKELTDKTLAKFLHDLPQRLAKDKPSHLDSLENYVKKAKELI